MVTMTGGDWNPQQYDRFAAERAQPFWDLIELVERLAERPLMDAVDLGCGTGALTASGLVDRLGLGDVVGIDSSAAMLAQAAAHERPGLRFEHGDIARWTGAADHDLVVANASLQWVGDHTAVLARWWAALRPGGVLAVQVPTNADHPSHRLAAAVAHREPFRSAMGGAPPADTVAANVLAPEIYATVLHDLGAADQHVRLQVYGHVVASTAEVVEWVKGTALTRIFGVLPAELHEVYLDVYRTELLAALGDPRPYFYAFKRILFAARKPS